MTCWPFARGPESSGRHVRRYCASREVVPTPTDIGGVLTRSLEPVLSIKSQFPSVQQYPFRVKLHPREWQPRKVGPIQGSNSKCSASRTDIAMLFLDVGPHQQYSACTDMMSNVAAWRTSGKLTVWYGVVIIYESLQETSSHNSATEDPDECLQHKMRRVRRPELDTPDSLTIANPTNSSLPPHASIPRPPHTQRRKSCLPPDTMFLKMLTLLCLAAGTTVHAGALMKKDCVDYVGNSWGCSAPGGEDVANYCVIQGDGSRTVCLPSRYPPSPSMVMVLQKEVNLSFEKRSSCCASAWS